MKKLCALLSLAICVGAGPAFAGTCDGAGTHLPNPMPVMNQMQCPTCFVYAEWQALNYFYNSQHNPNPPGLGTSLGNPMNGATIPAALGSLGGFLSPPKGPATPVGGRPHKPKDPNATQPPGQVHNYGNDCYGAVNSQLAAGQPALIGINANCIPGGGNGGHAVVAIGCQGGANGTITIQNSWGPGPAGNGSYTIPTSCLSQPASPSNGNVAGCVGSGGITN